jgi:hypothetical protein
MVGPHAAASLMCALILDRSGPRVSSLSRRSWCHPAWRMAPFRSTPVGAKRRVRPCAGPAQTPCPGQRGSRESVDRPTPRRQGTRLRCLCGGGIPGPADRFPFPRHPRDPRATAPSAPRGKLPSASLRPTSARRLSQAGKGSSIWRPPHDARERLVHAVQRLRALTQIRRRFSALDVTKSAGASPSASKPAPNRTSEAKTRRTRGR